MPDQDYATIAALLCSVLLIALIIPAPTRPPRHEVGLPLTLLGLGAALAILAGVYALAQLPVHSAGSGALAWLIVMPCLWLARGPRPAEGYGYEDEDDDGGEPAPRWPGAPPFPGGNRPERARPGLASAGAAWAHSTGRPLTQAQLPQHAIASHPAAASAVGEASAVAAGNAVGEASAVAAGNAVGETGAVVQASAPAAPGSPIPASDPAPASIPVFAEPAAASRQRRLKPRPRPARADHRSIVHVRAAAPHSGRRRRASLRRRVLDRCRRWLWVEPPECVTFYEPEHEPRRRPGTDPRRDARAAPLG